MIDELVAEAITEEELRKRSLFLARSRGSWRRSPIYEDLARRLLGLEDGQSLLVTIPPLHRTPELAEVYRKRIFAALRRRCSEQGYRVRSRLYSDFKIAFSREK